jgi:hypothetical protein
MLPVARRPSVSQLSHSSLASETLPVKILGSPVPSTMPRLCVHEACFSPEPKLQLPLSR